MSPGTTTPPYLQEKRAAYGAPRAQSRRRMIIIGASIGGLLVIIAIALGVYFGVVKNKSSSDEASGSLGDGASSAKPSGTNTPNPGTRTAVTGGDGSKVTMEDGTTFVYSNPLGGYWYWDENDPFNNGARAQSFSPALNETFRYGIDQIRGVNIGGWLVTEPVSRILLTVPALYEKFANATTPAVDEWTLSQNLAADTANGGLQQLEDHYKTFITEKDFAEIAGAGLNFVRIPIPYWAIETRDNEPFLAKTCWKYFLKAVQWARKYGIRINLDLHALPGSQNGWNHSGRLGTINFLNGPMGYANAQRSLDYIRILAEFISQPQYRDVVVMFGITNEPQGPTFGLENLVRYSLEAYNIVRTASGTGEGNGPIISFHEGFAGLDKWAGFFTNSDRTSLDIHPYIAFGGQSADGYDARTNTPCDSWAANQNQSMAAFGLTTAGEFSNAINDCGLYVNGVNLGTRYEGTYTPGSWPRIGDCDKWTDYQNWDNDMKQDIKKFALASMDALQNYFFWTWKIGNSSVTGKVESPAWSYQLGLQEGWMPKDPREAIGACGNTAPFKGPLQDWQTGGAKSYNMPATFTSSYAWPPTAITSAGAVTDLPSYTPTGSLITLPGPTFTKSAGGSVDVGSGWANSADSTGMMVPIPTCSYLDPWVGPTAAPPSPLCGGSARRDSIPPPVITPAP
ncbi:exo-beta-1,3-glucanase [Panus rudis PR-1116 ss-1]|nr:exo-beta-1,3-glucanase [Panus rudis PR-1116 ss-1]